MDQIQGTHDVVQPSGFYFLSDTLVFCFPFGVYRVSERLRRARRRTIGCWGNRGCSVEFEGNALSLLQIGKTGSWCWLWKIAGCVASPRAFVKWKAEATDWGDLKNWQFLHLRAFGRASRRGEATGSGSIYGWKAAGLPLRRGNYEEAKPRANH